MNLFKEFAAFSKAQVSAFLGGLVDYLVMLACVELFGTHYVFGIVVGGCIGAVINYSINRYWTFKGKYQKASSQLGKFVLVVLGSILLKSAGTSFLTEVVHIDYRISRILTDIFVSLGFNYVLQRFWIFRKQVVKF